MPETHPTTLNCPACGAPLDFDGTSAVVRCKFCHNVSLISDFLPKQAAAPGSSLDEIRQLTGNGKLDEALEKYRQIYGVDQDEAKDAVDALQAGRLVTPSTLGIHSPEELTKALQEVQRLLSAGDKIGAIKVYRENYDVSLARAKYAIEQIEAGQTAFPEAGFNVQVAPAPGGVGAAGKRLGWVILIAILLFVGGIVAFALMQPGGPFVPHLISNGPIALVRRDQGTAPNFIVGFYNPDKDTHFFGFVDGATGKLLWQAAKLSGDRNASAVMNGTDLVYAVNGTDLLAYRKSDGSLAWQA